MKIKIDKVKGGFRADFIELSGSPTVGTGKDIASAIATLFIRNYKYLDQLDMTYLEIDGKLYEDYIINDR